MGLKSGVSQWVSGQWCTVRKVADTALAPAGRRDFVAAREKRGKIILAKVGQAVVPR